MAFSEPLAARIRKSLGGNPDVTEKKMFGGIAFMQQRNMAFGIIGEDLMVRVGPAAHDASLSKPGARPMDFTGRPMKGYIFVGSAGYTSKRSLESWMQAGLSFCETLPRKKKK